jgi:fimbrial chaperone protein
MLTCLLLGMLSSQAFTLTPISATLSPKANGAAASFRVENESSNRVAFQIKMITREMDEHGQETCELATNVFTVFPPQGIIAPGQRQNIRVVWKGAAAPTNELAYRIVAEELPVPLDTEQAGSHIKLLVRYMGTVYVAPRKPKSDLQTVGLVRVATTASSTNTYELTLRNQGNVHQGLKNPTLKINGGKDGPLLLKADQLNGITGENVLAQHTRRFSLVLPADFTVDSYQAELQVDE